VRRAFQALDQEVANVFDGWDFDADAYFQSGAFADELIAAGQRAGLNVALLDNRLYSYPALIRVLPGDRAVLIDKARERRVRPSVLVELLRELQKRPARFRALDFLEALFLAYTVAVERRPGRRSMGSSVPLNELYDLFTLLPGTAREYSRQEFARDVYLLDQSGQTETRDGERIEFDASTGTKLRRGTLTVVAQNGQEKHYYAISFTRARGA
jgi:hypothetical protein